MRNEAMLKSTPNTNMINFFQVRKKDNRFYRVFARLVTFKRHSIVIERHGKRYVIESKYPLDRMLIARNTLVAFSYKSKNEKYQQLYRLPQNRNYFDPEIDLEINYDYSSLRNVGEYIDADEKIQAKRRKLEGLKTQILAELRFLEDYAQESLEFMESLSKSFLTSKSKRKYYDIVLGEEDSREEIPQKRKEVNKISKKDYKKAKLHSKKTKDQFF